MNSKIVIGTVIGLIAGLVLGVFIGVMFISPNAILPIKAGAGTDNQVQVSGRVSATQTGTIKFSTGSFSNDIKTSGPITNNQYSVLLVGGKSYDVAVYNQNGGYVYSYSLYAPTGVTTFTADF